MLKIKSDNPNYLAKIVALPELRPHNNADKLAIAVIGGQSIITSKSSKPGELYVLFQLESQINPEFISYINGYADPLLNRDKKTKSFFHKPRVKTIKLRGIVSEGYLHPVRELNDWLKEKGIKYQITESDLNTEFDTIGDIPFTEKYVNPETLRKLAQANRVKGGRVKRESRLVDNQFRLSPDYKQLKREIYSVNPDDWIELTSKWHGANGTIAKVLTKRKLSLIEKLVRFIGVKVKEEEYDLVFSSRRVIKNQFADQKTMDFYDSNIWEIVAKKYQESIKNSLTCYGEVVGYTPTGAGIQSMGGKVYDYGCEVGKCDFIVFRITYTSPAGDVYEFSLQQVIDYCNKYGLKHVPVYYIGRAKDKYPELDTTNHWHENFLNKLIEEYLEKDCQYCNNKPLADEGIVLSKRVGVFEGLKLKSAKFLIGESDAVDKGELNMDEEAQSVEATT